MISSIFETRVGQRRVDLDRCQILEPPGKQLIPKGKGFRIKFGSWQRDRNIRAGPLHHVNGYGATLGGIVAKRLPHRKQLRREAVKGLRLVLISNALHERSAGLKPLADDLVKLGTKLGIVGLVEFVRD